MSEAHTPPTTTHHVLLWRTYRFAAWWTKGLGRHAGKILALMPVATILLLLVWIFVINGLCSILSADFETCQSAFNIANRLVAFALIGVFILCLASLLGRAAFAIWRRQRRKEAEATVRSLRSQLGGKDPLAEPRYAALDERLREANGPELVPLRVALFLLLPTLLMPFLILLAFLAAAEKFEEFGSLFVVEFTKEAQDYALLEIGVVVAVVAALRLIRTMLASRRIVREHWDDLQTQLGAATTELLRNHKDPMGRTAPETAFTFRSYDAPARNPN